MLGSRRSLGVCTYLRALDRLEGSAARAAVVLDREQLLAE